MNEHAQRVGAFDSGWDFAFTKLFQYIRYSGMCKNHDFSDLCLRKVACGDDRKMDFLLIKILQSNQTPLIDLIHNRVVK